MGSATSSPGTLPDADVNKLLFVSDGFASATFGAVVTSIETDGDGTGPEQEFSIEAVGINVNSTALALLSEVEGSGGSATNITEANELTALLGDLITSSSTITGTGSVDILVGGAGAEQILGLGGNDTLIGGGGNDTLDGAGGNDTLIGGAGVDTAFYLNNSSTSGLIIDLATGTVTDDGLGNAEVALNFENVEGTIFDDQITGSAVANRLDGHAGDDTISGGAGNDTLIGGQGADLMDGGIGNDTYQYDEIADGTQITTNQTPSASGLAHDEINDFNTVEDGFVFDEAAFGDVAGTPLVALASEYDGTNSGLASGAAFIIDSTLHLSFDPDVNTPGYTVIAGVSSTVLPSDINPL